MNFNFLAGQQQMSGQQPGMKQSFPRQPFALGDAQLLSQLHRQKQFQQLDPMQRNVSNQIPNFPNQMVSQHSPTINGNPMYDTSDHPWASQVMTSNTNWSQRGLSPPIQGYSNGVVMTSEQDQALHLMGSAPQYSQSLYGVPVSSSRNADTFSVNSINKPAVHQDGTTLSRLRSEGKSSFEHGSSQGFTHVASFGSFNEMQQKNALISESGRQDCAGGTKLLREKPVTQSTTKQCAVALDPTEEKILFGSDENIWEAFGNTVGTEGVNQEDGSDLSNGFLTLQGGSWSALMQSAAAETSSTDVGMQENWSSFGNQSTKFQAGNQPSSISQDYVSEQPVWIDMSQTVSLDRTNATNDVNNNYVNSSGQQQPFPSQPRQSLPTESQITQERRNWLDESQSMQYTQKNWPVGNANPSRDLPNKSDNRFWSDQQRTFLYDNNERTSGRPAALNFIESIQTNGIMTAVDQDNLNDKEHNRPRPIYTSHSDTRIPESITNFNVGMTKSRVSSADNAVPSDLANKINYESERKFPGSRHVDFWKSVHYGIDGSGKEQHNLNEGPPILDSSVGIPNAEASEVHMTESVGVEENSNDSHQSSFSHRTPSVGLSENVWTAGDQQSSPGDKENNPLEHATERMCLTRKFQYHPMGDLDMDVDSCSYASKEIRRLPRHLSSGVRSHEVHARFLGQSKSTVMNSSDLMEGEVFLHEALKTSDVPPNRSANSTHFTKSDELSSQRQTLSSSQNMLELFHKVDQSTEQASSASHLSPEIGSGGPFRLNQGQSSASHGFNLQLAPPSQAIAPSNLNIASQSSSRGADSLGSGFAAFGKGDKGHAWLASVSSAQYSPSSHPPAQMGSENSKSGASGSIGVDVSQPNFKGNPSTPLSSSSPYLRNSNTLQHHHMAVTDEKMTSDQSTWPFHMRANVHQQTSNSEDRATARQSVSNSLNDLASGTDMNQLGLRASTHQIPMSLHGSIPGMIKNDNLYSAESFKSQFHSDDLPKTSCLTQQQPDEQDRLLQVKANAVCFQGIVGGMEPMSAEAQPTGKAVGAFQGEYIAKHPSDASFSNSAGSKKDLEAFHHSNITIQQYSSLHQTQAMKGINWSHHESNRLKREDDFPRVPMTKNADQQFAGWKPSNNLDECASMQLASAKVDPSLLSNDCETASTYAPSEQVCSLDTHVSNQTLASIRPKKRKTATSDLLSWSKEIGQGFTRLQNTSSAEVDWARSSRRLVEKVEDETDANGDIRRISRPKRRLILTTQLMQQVFQSPSPAVLSLVSSSSNEVILYSLARLTVGDACSLVSFSKSDSFVHLGSGNLVKTSEARGDQQFSKAVQEFVDRAKELENELSRLDKRASILEYRLEHQDMERFAVINRFAMYHGPGQVDGSVSTSSSSDPTAIPHRAYPQRYVSAHPMPRNIPDRVQCLSL